MFNENKADTKNILSTTKLRKILHRLLYLSLIAGLFSVVSCEENVILTPEEQQWLVTHPDLSVAMLPIYPPYQFVNDDDKINGIFIDFFNLIEDKIGYKFERHYYSDWKSIMEDARKGDIDVIFEIQETKERKNYLSFTPPLFRQPHAIVARDYVSKGSGIEHFNHQKVAVVDDYAVKEYLSLKYPEITLYPVVNDEAGLEAVIDGVVNAFVSQKAAISYFLDKDKIKDLHIISEIHYINALGIANRKELTTLSSILNKVVTSISTEEQQAVLDNWVYEVVKPFYLRPLFWYTITGVLLTLFILSLIFSTLLKKQVRKKTLMLSKAKDRAEECDRLKTAFLQNISHEIRTPMNGIVGFTELLNSELSVEERKQYIDIITSSSKQLIRVINDIIEISELENTQVPLHPEKIVIHEFLSRLVTIFESQAKEKKIPLHLECNLSKAGNTIRIDKVKLRKVISHILENAIKYTDKGSITMSCSIESPWFKIKIKDTGIGIKKEDQVLIFERFSQVDKTLSGNYGGLGLGLSIAKENATLLGGTVEVESLQDEGSVFLITVPFTAVVDDNHSNINDYTFDSPRTGMAYKILITEDSNVNYLYLRKVLEKTEHYDFTILRAENGKEAVQICEEMQDLDLVFMDIKMPIMDGYEATRMIKKRYPTLPIIVQTAYSTPKDINRAYNAGCDDFLAKPIDRNKMILLLEKYIAIRRLSSPSI